MLKKWGVRVGDSAASFSRLDTANAGVVRFDDFARWVMRAQMDSMASGMLLRNAHAPAEDAARPPPSAAMREKELNTLALSLGAGETLIGSDGRRRYGGSVHSPPTRHRSPPKPHRFDDGRGARGGGKPARAVPARPRSAKFDLTEKLSQVGMQQYARKLKQLGFDDVRQLLSLQYAADSRDNNRLDPMEASFATLLDQLHLMPGHRVRMIQFFQNESRNATSAAHSRMLDDANARHKEVSAAEARNEEELKLLRMRLLEMENEVHVAHQQEHAAVNAAKRAWEEAHTMPLATGVPTATWPPADAPPARDLGAERAADEAAAAEKEAAAEARAKKFLRRLMNRNVALAFNQWFDITESVLRLKHIMYRWQQRGLARAFDQWHTSNDRSAHAGEVESVASKFVRRLVNKKLAAGWEAWYSWWAEAREARDKLKSVASRLKNPGLSKAFYRWMETALSRAAKLRLLRRFLQRHFSEGLSKGWNTWMAYVEPFRVIQRAAKAILNQGLVRAWNQWLESTSHNDELHRQRALMTSFVSRLGNMELSRGWASWREYIDARVSAWMRLDRVARRWRLMGASNAWATWAGFAEARAENERLLTSFAGRLQNLEVGRAWNTWAAVCDDARKMKLAVLGIMSPLLRKTCAPAHMHAQAPCPLPPAFLTALTSPPYHGPCRWMGWVRYHQMQHEGVIKKAGRKLWGVEHFFASIMWTIEQKTEHMLHLDRRARRAATRARQRALLGVDLSDSDSDDDAPLPPRRATAKVEPLYEDVTLPATDGPFGAARRREGRAAQVRGGGYLTESSYLQYPLDDAGTNNAATAFIRMGGNEPPGYVRQASMQATRSVDRRLSPDDGAGVGFSR